MDIFIEVLGYVGMALTIASFTMKNALWIRIVNMSGSVFSLVYGILTNTIPTAALNGALFAINAGFVIAHFVKKSKEKKKKIEENGN